jgi:penicillin-binding protein 1A
MRQQAAVICKKEWEMKNVQRTDVLTKTRRRRKAVKWIFLSLLILLCLTAAVGAFVFSRIAAKAPALDLKDVSPEDYFSTVLDDGGERILNLTGAESNRVYVTLEEIPDDLENAVIAIEDKRFYDHKGVDLRGILRALTRNITSGSMSEGASTITQQLIKNNVLTGWTEEKTFSEKITRKIQEQALARKLEKQTSKAWILENYLNTVNLGCGAWGVEAASMRYFGKHVSQLSLSECAVLAGIIKSPSYLDPLYSPEENDGRRLTVLSLMLDQEMISQQQYDEAAADDPYERIRQDNVPAGAEVFSYFEDALILQVIGDMTETLGWDEETAWHTLYSGGLTVESTQDSRLQAICEEEINDEIHYYGDDQATVVIIEQATGQVKAIVGGRGKKEASLTFNRATDSVRQPGSTMKIVGEYTAALDTGIATLATVYDDAPYTYTDGTELYDASGTYAGRTTVREAIVHSANIPALKCFQQVGLSRVWSYLSAYGFTHLTDADKVEALALGGTNGGVTNLELTAAYSAIANGGTYREPAYYTRVLDRDGSVLLSRESSGTPVMNRTTAALLTDAMEDVMDRGTGTTADVAGVALAGKSGTTNAMADQWFVGFSPVYTCGVWGGHDDYSPSEDSTFVKYIWRAVMARANEGLGTADSLLADDSLVTKTVCTKCGKLAIAGTCDHTVQGDMTALESFAPGTEPTEQCDCHVTVRICRASGVKAGSYCPGTGTESRVYLAEGTEGTPDALAVYDGGSETCPVHQHWWNTLFPNKGTGTEPETTQEDPEAPEEEQEEEEDFWHKWFSWLY